MNWNWLRISKQAVAALTLASVTLLGSVAYGQDFGTAKGDNARTGKRNDPGPTADPTNYFNGGLGILNWFHPNATENRRYPVTVDDDGWRQAGGAAASNTSAVSSLAAWTIPATTEQAAFSFSLTTPAPRTSYQYTAATPSAVGSQTTAQTPANLNSFTWTVQPSEGTPGNYQIYVWLPQGPTQLAGGNVFNTRYFVYTIQSAGGNTYTDIVDTTLGGGGWLRLGNGGASTNRLFQYDGSTPLKVTLYNTIPRDSKGNLMDPDLTRIVYADAVMAVPDQGSFYAQPIVSTLPSTRTFVFSPQTTRTISLLNGIPETFENGQLNAYDFGTGVLQWTYATAGSDAGQVVDNESVNVIAAFPFVIDTTNTNHYGLDYFSAAIVNDPAAASNVTYQPLLQDGDYDIYVYLVGNGGGENYGTQVQYTVNEGTTVTNFTIDQTAVTTPGWVRLGNRKFHNNNETGNYLTASVSNYSPLPGDAGKLSYADAFWFVGANSGALRSTPVYAKALIKPDAVSAPVEKPVVIVATADGKLTCLDAQGNGDGTTNVYWTYPSTPDTTNPAWTDPNQVAGLDGPGGIAQMPSGFNTSSALVQRVTVAGTPTDYLYIGANNGRVYCIDMTGRGDYNFATKKIGSTQRVWSFPDDYPSVAVPATLGVFRGSVAFTTNATGPTLIVPTGQGRIYALDALGDPITKKTTVEWAYPARTAAPLGPISSTPAVAFGQVFVGSELPVGGGLAKFVALNQDTGAVNWFYTSANSYFGGPAAVPATNLSGGMPDTVFVSNSDTSITAYKASDGTQLWTSSELPTFARGPLTFANMVVLQSSGILGTAPEPQILVPGVDGRYTALFANTATTNRFGTRRSWEYLTDGPVSVGASQFATASTPSVGYLYGGDENGFIYCWGPTSSTSGGDPGGGGSPENDHTGDGAFRQVKVKFINQTLYNALKAGTANYAAVDSAPAVPNGFEWGETMYAVEYNFAGLDNSTPSGRPPIGSFQIGINGQSLRTINVEGYQFGAGDTSVPTDAVSGKRLDGFVPFSMIVQGAGINAIPPGSGGKIVCGLSANITGTGGQQNIALNPANSVLSFSIANPLALSMDGTTANGIGWDTDPTKAMNVVNGSPLVGGTDYTRMGRSFNVASHGGTGSTQIQVLDRSLMSLMLGPGRGLPNVRVQRRDLAWQGGAGAVYKPLPAFATGMEDLPTNLPNGSLDYPDLKKNSIRVTKDLLGTPENPLFNGVTLNAPTGVVAGSPLSRTIVPTPFDFDVDVPKFQPANLSVFSDFVGNLLAAGYLGSITVFVDSNGSGVFDQNNRSAYRDFNLMGQVSVDEKMHVRTPIVDLGSLPGGTGYAPIQPWLDTAFTFSPWTGVFSTLFQPFTVINDGNVNMLNLRLAKGAKYGTGPLQPYGVTANGNDLLSWLDGSYNLWSDIDSRYYVAPSGPGYSSVILQKARVGDNSGTQLLANPMRRSNGNLGQVQGPLNNTGPNPAPPRVAITIPFGFPVGNYSMDMHVVEDIVGNEALNYDVNNVLTETITDPGFKLKFNVVESRLTNSFSKGAAPMLDNLITGGTPPQFTYTNLQPAVTRDTLGNFVMVYASDRTTSAPATLPTAPGTGATNLYFATLPGSLISAAAGNSPLRDLNFFQPQSTQWLGQPLGPWPTTSPATLFNVGAGESIVAGSAKFRNPALPANGMVNSLTLGALPKVTLAFVGDAIKQTPNGQLDVSDLFVADLTVDNAGAVTMGTPVALGNQTSRKGKPSVIQLDGKAVIFYSEQSESRGSISYVLYDGTTLSAPVRVPLGGQFETVSAPSISIRTRPGTPATVYDIAFSGKLGTSENSEIFRATVAADATTKLPDFTNGFLVSPTSESEFIQATGQPGVYRSTGINWFISHLSTDVKLEYVNAAGTATLVHAMSDQDAFSNGIISFESALGGRVYMDTLSGTITVSKPIINKNLRLRLTYMPAIHRVSLPSAASYSGPSLLLDNHQVGDASGTTLSYWADSTNTAVPVGTNVQPNRLFLTYRRAALGANQAARPFMTSLRLGYDFGQPLQTNAAGALTNFTVSGMASGDYYQVDPVQGKIYFTSGEEDNTGITVTYNTADGVTHTNIPINPTWIAEILEKPVPIENATNESPLTVLGDPMIAPTGQQRPALFWLFWSSLRNGSPDLYFQTLSPGFVATPKN